MNRADLWLKIVELLVASIGVAVPTYVAYNLHSKGPSAEKELEVEHSLKLNVTGGLSLVGEKAQLTLAFEGKPVGDIWVVRDVLRNTGRVAVLPGDYIGRIVLSHSPALEDSRRGQLACDARKCGPSLDARE